VLQLGIPDVIVQKISNAKARHEVHETARASYAVLVLQSLLLVVAAALGGKLISGWLFGADHAAAHAWEVRFVLITTIGVLALQTTTAILNGELLVAEATRVGIVTSAATLATVYPFLLLGNIGLAFVIGATCFVGAGLGLGYVVRSDGLGPSGLRISGRAGELKRILPVSWALALEPVTVTGSGLVVQAIVSRHYGLDALGLFNAATLLEGTAVTVLTASMRSYYLPALGRLGTAAEKHRFVNQVLQLLLAATVIGVALMIVLGPLALRILFSGRFAGAAQLTAIFGVSIVGQMFTWCYAMYFLHRADYRMRFWLDGAWALVRVAGSLACVVLALPLTALAWVYVASYAVAGVLNCAFAMRHAGRGMLGVGNALFGLVALALLSATAAVAPRAPGEALAGCGAAFVAAGAALVAWRRAERKR
jgi:PST family polysaccharide transporter